MARALSQDLGDRVIAAGDGGMSRNAAAARFEVAVSTAVRWLHAWRTDAVATARPKGGDLRSRRIERHRDVILAAVEAQVDITLVELAALLRDRHGASVAPSMIWRFLDRHDMTVKKWLTPASRSGPTSPGAGGTGSTTSLILIQSGWCSSTRPEPRSRWRACADGRRGATLLGTNPAWAREDHHLHRGAAPVRPDGSDLRWLCHRLLRSRIAKAMVLDGPMTTEAFHAYVEQVLAPTLRPGDIAVMDNLPAHKGSTIGSLIKASDASLRYLPPYSPDFNPIENAFSKLKAILRKTAARAIDDLWTVVGNAMPTFSSGECAAYFTAAGCEPE